MSSIYTPSLTLTQIGNGEQSGTWGTTTNTNWQLIEDAVAGVAQVSVSGTSGAPLSVANGTTDQARKAVIVVTGATSGTNAIVAPLQPKVYLVSNQTTGGFNITIGASTGSVVTIPNGVTTLVYCDGTNFSSGITGFTGGNLSITGNITATGTITGATFATSGGVPQLAGGATGQIPYQTGSNATAYTPAPTTGSYLTWTGSAYSWSTGSVTTATNLAGGSAWSVPYQTSAGNTSFLTPSGSTPLTLQWNGSSVSWAPGGAVTSVSAGTTGLTPSTPTTGAVVLGGVLNVANGGTQLSSSGTSGNLLVSNGSAWVSQSPATAGLAALSGAAFTGTVTSSGGSFTSNNAGYASIGSGSVTLGQSNTGIYTAGTGGSIAYGFQLNNITYCAMTSASFGPGNDNSYACASGANRWSVVYAATGTINTSDANEKQQIQDLTAAEKAVGQALKGMMKSFKFNDSVQEKGANARIHFGVIAQDVQAAFAAQGLNPENYGVFCSDTWYEVDGKAMNNVMDADGNHKLESYTKDSPGAVERTRLGVRYEELFALILGAI